MKNLSTHRFVATFTKKLSLTAAKKVASITHVEQRGDEYEFTISGEVADFVKFISDYQPKTLHESELELEEIFMRYYEHSERRAT
jgi:hypothetical protein